jgi:hypothetical protein
LESSSTGGNEPSGSTNYWEFHDQLNNYQHHNTNCCIEIAPRILTITENLNRTIFVHQTQLYISKEVNVYIQYINQKNAFNKILFMTSTKFPHISASECHPQGLLQQRHGSPTRQSRYCIALTKIIKTLKFHNTQSFNNSSEGDAIPGLVCWTCILYWKKPRG